jgi:hypothetical protein
MFTHTNCKTGHSVSDRDKEVRLKFCLQFQGLLTENPDLPNNLLMSDEVHFHLHGTVNKQKFWYWPAANPHELHRRPPYNPEFTVWCAVWSRGVIWRHFFEDEDGQAIRVTSQRYTVLINEFLAPKLPPNHTLCFQHDGATEHTPVLSMAALRSLFTQRVVSRFSDVTWPPRSPDLTVHDSLLWGYFISKVYSTRPADLHALKQK